MAKFSCYSPVQWLLLVTLLHLARANMEYNGKFFTKWLKNYKDCEQYARQHRYHIARCEGYYNPKDGDFYLDQSFRYSIEKCALYNNQSVTQLPVIIYKIRDIVDYGNGSIVMSMHRLEAAVDAHIELVPQITMLEGPRGNKSETAMNIRKISTSWVAIAPSEKEMRLAFYPQIFFDQLMLAELGSIVPNKYLMLNGWHLKNIPEPPLIDRNLLNIFVGLIIWVERSHAHFIGKNEVVKFLNGSTSIPVWFDMPGSPEIGGATQLKTPLLFVVTIVALIGFNHRNHRIE